MAKTLTDLARAKRALETVADTVGKTKRGTIIARRGFYYRFTSTATKFKESVSGRLDAAGIEHEVVDFYEKWTSFNGAASVASSSHWGVEFRVKGGAKNG